MLSRLHYGEWAEVVEEGGMSAMGGSFSMDPEISIRRSSFHTDKQRSLRAERKRGASSAGKIDKDVE